MFYWDPTYILVLIGVLISAAASYNVNRTFSKYDTPSRCRLNAGEVAEVILRSAGIDDVRIERVGGKLSDHYSPNERVLRLSDGVFASRSIAAIGIAAHECGHAIQHKQGYAPLKLRSASASVANIGSMLSWPLIVLGVILGYSGLARLGVGLFTLVVAFQLITLPVEFNASRRAMAILGSGGLLTGSDLDGAGKVLKAAALTYVAALLTSVLQLLRLILIVRRSDRD